MSDVAATTGWRDFKAAKKPIIFKVHCSKATMNRLGTWIDVKQPRTSWTILCSRNDRGWRRRPKDEVYDDGITYVELERAEVSEEN